MAVSVRSILDRLWPDAPATKDDLGARALVVLGNGARTAAASTIAFVIANAVLPGRVDLTPALAALLVMQTSVTTTLRSGLLRMLAVSLGVGTAVAFAMFFGMHWWSLALVVFTALVMARALRLGDSVLEVPISAMLILGSVGADVAAGNRLLGTLIGAIVGMLLPLLLPPSIPARSVSASVRGVAEAERDLLVRAANELGQQTASRQMIDGWLARTRTLTGQVAKAHERITTLTEVRRLNSRASGTADVSPILRSGLDSLEYCLISLRSLMLILNRDAPATGEREHSWLDSQVQSSLAQVLRDLGDCLAAFGQMVQAEANGNEADAQAVFARNYRAVRDARADLRHMLESHDVIANQWMTSGSLLMGIDQILTQLDLDARKRVRQRWKESQLGRSLPQAHIGPRTTPIDRMLHERMRARQRGKAAAEREAAHRRATSADFIDDGEPTQQIPVIREGVTKRPSAARVRSSRRPSSPRTPTDPES